MGPGVRLEQIATEQWRVSVIREQGVTSAVEGRRKAIAKLAGRAVRLLHRWDLVPPEEPARHSDSGAYELLPRLRRRYLVFRHRGEPYVISQVLASFANFELAQMFLWSEMDHGDMRAAILDQDTNEVIVDPTAEPARVKHTVTA